MTPLSACHGANGVMARLLNLFGWLRRQRPSPERVRLAEPPPDVDPIEELIRLVDEDAAEPVPKTSRSAQRRLPRR